MSSQTMPAVSAAFQFAAEKVKENVIEFVRRENIQLDENSQKKILNIIQSSLEQSFVLTSNSIHKTLK